MGHASAFFFVAENFAVWAMVITIFVVPYVANIEIKVLEILLGAYFYTTRQESKFFFWHEGEMMRIKNEIIRIITSS